MDTSNDQELELPNVESKTEEAVLKFTGTMAIDFAAWLYEQGFSIYAPGKDNFLELEDLPDLVISWLQVLTVETESDADNSTNE